MYVQRDANGDITLVSAAVRDDCNEYVAVDSPELQAFISQENEDNQGNMRESDLDFVRVLEDVISLLVEKGVIRFTELPAQARDKLSQRESMRSRINSISLLGESDDEGLI